MASWRFEAIGTHWEIETTDALPESLMAAVSAEIERFDREWSRFRSDSDVSRLGREGGALASTDAGPMLDAYRELSVATGEPSTRSSPTASTRSGMTRTTL